MKTAPGAKVVTLAQLRARKWPPREMLLDPWLRDGESCLLHAKTGLGKTMLTLSLALALAGGGEVCGWRSPKARRVLVVDGEMHMQDLDTRLDDLAPTVAGADPKAQVENLHVFARQDQDAEFRFPDLVTPEGQDAILEMLLERRTEVVILDNLTTLAGIEDENSASAFRPVLGFLMRLKQAGIAVILVHHSGKGAAETYRGSSALATTFETIIGLTPTPEGGTDGNAAFVLKFSKVRAARGTWAGTRRLKLAEGTGGGASWVTEEDDTAQEEILLTLLKTGQHDSERALGRAMGGMSHQAVGRLRDRLFLRKAITEKDWKGWLKHAKDTPDGPGMPEDPAEAALGAGDF